MNDLDLRLEVVWGSRQPYLHYIWRSISRKPLEIEVWFQRTTNRKWHMAYRMVTWPMTSLDLERSNSWPQYAYIAISRKWPFQRTTNRKWHTGYKLSNSHVTDDVTWLPKVLRDSTVGYPSDSWLQRDEISVIVLQISLAICNHHLDCAIFVMLLTYLLKFLRSNKYVM